MSDFEKTVLDKLTAMESDIKEIKSDVTELKADIKEIKVTVDGIQERTMILCESLGIAEEKIKSMKEIIIDNEIEIKAIKRKIG